MRWFLFVSMFAARIGLAGLEEYPELVQPQPGERAGQGGIRVTYLGVNGYQFEAAGHALLVDPYFSRLGMLESGMGRDVEPDLARIESGLKEGKVRRRVDAVLVTHAHIDHLLDVKPIIHRTGARLFSGPTAIEQMRSLRVPESKLREVAHGAVRKIGPWTIRVFRAEHDSILGLVPFPGPRRNHPPKKASDWVLGEPLAFLIEAAGQRIFINSGGVPENLPPGIKVNLTILGVALPDSRRAFAPSLRQLRPDYVLPSHQDDFFRPAGDGFAFSKLSSFPTVYRIWKKEGHGSKLILLDYFRPWTLR